MKLLLVQVPTSHLGAGEKVYPLGLSRLSSLVPMGMEKEVLDMNVHADPWALLQKMVEDRMPEVVVLSFRNLDPLAGHQASYLSSLRTVAQLVRTLAPDARIIAGGPAFSLFGERLMQEIPEINLGLVGEGELVFAQILSGNVDTEHIPGIVWRRDGMLITNPPGPHISMDQIPRLDTTSFNPMGYAKGNSYVASMGIEGKRGCDLLCAYCLYPFLGGGCLRLRSPVKIVDEMEMLHAEYGTQLFHFTDGVLNRPADHFEALCRELLHRKLNVSWTGFLREDSLTSENLDLAMKAGLVAIYFSGDALTDGGLRILNKQLNTNQILDAARLTAEKGILTMCHFLVNLPGDDDESIALSSQMLDKLLDIHHSAGNLGAVIFNHVRLYPGAPLTRRLIKSGSLDSQTDFLYPVYHNPAKYNHVLHEFEGRCHSSGVFSRLGLDGQPAREKVA